MSMGGNGRLPLKPVAIVACNLQGVSHQSLYTTNSDYFQGWHVSLLHRTVQSLEGSMSAPAV